MTALPRGASDSADHPLVPTRDDLEAFNEHTRALEHAARVRDLAFEMLHTLEGIASYEYVMDHAFSSVMRAKIRAILKEAHGA